MNSSKLLISRQALSRQRISRRVLARHTLARHTLARQTLARCLVALLLAAAILPMAIAAAPAVDAVEVETCQVRSDQLVPPYDSNFDIDPSYVDSSGLYRLAILFADFPDAPATSTPQETFEQVWTDEVQDYFTAQSQGRLTVEAVPDDTWRRMENESIEYVNGNEPSYRIIEQAIEQADPTFDFTGIDMVMVVHEITSTTRFGQYVSAPVKVAFAEGGAVSWYGGINLGGRDRFGPQTPDFDRTDLFTIHEMMHTLGLLDHYDFFARLDGDEVGQRSFVGNFGPMGELGGYAGGVLSGTLSAYNGSEMMAWPRWQLGWIDDEQVVCTSGERVVEFLSPLPVPGGIKTVMMPLDEERVVVVETRVRQGYDRAMLQDGVLVYVVDTAKPGALGTFQVPGPYVGDWASSLDLMQPGETKVVEDILVEVISGGPAGYQVAIESYLCNGLIPTIDLGMGDSGMGTEGDDVILGTDQDDVIDGRGGNDTVCAGDGADTVVGGEGDDVLLGEGGADVLRGNAGRDTLLGGAGPDRLLGGIDEDILRGEGSDDYLGGFGGADQIFGGPGSDTIFGGFGADMIRGGSGDDVIRGLIGDDDIDGGAGNDVLDGDRGNDVIDGGDGNDRIGGGNADDILRGGNGDDILSGGKADDAIDGGDGMDECAGNKHVIADTAINCETVFGVP